jgi:hypothetical protein
MAALVQQVQQVQLVVQDLWEQRDLLDMTGLLVLQEALVLQVKPGLLDHREILVLLEQ